MADYTWPPSLPQKPLGAGYGETHGAIVVRTPMDAGPAKLRRRGLRPDLIACTFALDATQVATLQDFIDDSLLGVRRFNITHPRLGTTVEARIVPGADGELVRIDNVARDHYHAALTLEVLP